MHPLADLEHEVEQARTAALAWWGRELGQRPFAALPASAIGLREPCAYYTPNTQEKLRRELATYYPELTGSPELGLLYLVYACLSADPYTCPGNVIGTSA